MLGDFHKSACSNWENENNLAIKMRKHFREAANKQCFSNLFLATFTKTSLWKSQIFKLVQMNAFLGPFQRLSSQ